MKEKRSYALLALLAAIVVSVSLLAGLFSGSESFFEDRLFSPKPISPQVVIVAIDDKTINAVGQWPWPRATFAHLLDAVGTYKPAAVGVDVIFSEASRQGAGDDAVLAQTIKNEPYKTVLAGQAESVDVSGSAASATQLLLPLPVFQHAAAAVGLVNVIADRDGIVRSFPDPITTPSGVDDSFAVAVLKQAGDGADTVGLSPINRIVYAGAPGSVRTISASDVLSGDSNIDLAGKFVFIGATAESLHDSDKTPVSGGTDMAGVEIHAQIANMLLMHYSLMSLSAPMMIAWIFLAALLCAAIFMFAPSFEWAVGLSVVLGILYIIAGIVLFSNGVAINLIHVTLAWTFATILLSLYRFFGSEKERRMIRKTFSKYVAPHVLTELLKHPESIMLGGEEREVTLLFSDIRGFTTLSETMQPQELVRVLNLYFSAVTKAIIDNGGVLDKYIGDAIMAFWGAPIDEPLQADKAVHAAIGMITALEELNKTLKANGDPEIQIGVGVYTGKAVVGNIGSEHRFDYTAIGDTVNAASRIEGLTKEYKTPIIIGESTRQKLTEEFKLTPLGNASVKGRKEEISIYGVEL